MTRTFVPIPRIAALAVAITLFGAPIAAAQSPTAARREAATETPLLNPTAFARLVQQPRFGPSQDPVVVEPQQPRLLRSATTAATRATSAPRSAPPRQSWTPRNTFVWLLVGALGVVAYVSLCYASKCNSALSIG